MPTWTRCGGLVLALSSLACRAPEPGAFDLFSAAARTGAATAARGGFRFAAPPRLERVTIDGETRPAVVTTVAGFEWRGRVPRDARLHVGAQAIGGAAGDTAGLEVVVTAESEGDVEILAVLRASPGARRWLDGDASLDAFAGRETSLRFRASEPAAADRRVAWGPVTLEVGPSPAPERPNVLLILVDTLRADHVGAYGYGRATTPETDRRLAREGVVFERAYAQAPWTLPSVGSLFLGIQPGRFLSGTMGTFGLPAGESATPSLPEVFAARGYATAGFIANPTLHAGNGFARGFGTFYNPPLDLESMKRHADDLTPRAQAWLRAHQGRPFFLYVHYLDPHDPYLSPELVANRSPFLPDYEGPVTGDWVHGVYNGRLALPDPARDVPQLVALYDSEIHYVDAHIGRLLETLDPAVLARTLVVFTSDHGEELLDHGGWKHGQTLYEEQIHVPLILRWDGKLARGRRESAPVALLDLLPTLAAAAGVESRPQWEGLDLVAALAGGAPPPRRTIFAQHLASGPLRAAAVRDDQKLMLFNRAEAFAPADAMQAHLWRLDLARLARAEVYDLGADPGERVNRLPGGSTLPADLELLIHRQLDDQGGGLRIVAAGLGAGETSDVTIRFSRPPPRVVPFFLGPDDRLASSGTSLRLHLEGDGFLKGVLVDPPPESIAMVSWDGLARAFIGDGAPVATGAAVAPAALRAARWPLANAQAGLYLWTPARAAVRPQPRAEDAETLERLRALGYVE